MANGRAKAPRTKGGRQRSDFISQLPDDLLLMILSLLPMKDAILACCVSTRWRFLWCKLNQLNFDGSEALAKISKDHHLCDFERHKYVKLVNGVTESYINLMVDEFRVRFDLSRHYEFFIVRWLKFAVNKTVEVLELDLTEVGPKRRSPVERFDFPYAIWPGFKWDLFRWPTPNDAVVELVFVKILILKGVNVNDSIFHQFISNSPDLETLSIHNGGYLRYLEVGGRNLKLKHFEIVDCLEIKSIHLYDFDLVSFTYKGPSLDLRINDCPELKEIDIIEGKSGFENKLFRQIKSCVSFLQVVSLTVYHPTASLKLDSVPKLPNVKKLKLTIRAYQDVCLLQLTSIAKACSSLETFTIELLWYSPIKRRRKVTHIAAAQPLEHLKLLQFLGYYGRISDLELVAHVINNGPALKKIVIDPHCQGWIGSAHAKNLLKKVEAARSSAKRQLESVMPPGVELAIL